MKAFFINKPKAQAKKPGPLPSSAPARQKGQVIVEYILLLVVSTALALLLINLVSINSDSPGPFFNYWKNLLVVIGADISA